MAALRERRVSGRGQFVECADIEAVATIVPYLRQEYYGSTAKRTGTTGPGRDSYETADGGWVYFSLVAENAWQAFLAGCAIEADAVPDELRTAEGRADMVRLKAFIAQVVQGKDARELFLTLSTLRITTGIIFTPEDLTADPHLEARGFLHRINHPIAGGLALPGAPAQMTDTPMAAPGLAPAVGDQATGRRAGAIASALGTATIRAPLEGVVVLDLTAAWIGTYATMLLGDLGADVIKVESPTRPDVWRGAEGRGRGAPPCARPEAHIWNVNVNFNSVNRNKRSVCLDLDTEAGKALFLRLAAKADLVTENYTSRVMKNFGLAYEDLRKVNEDIITVSFSGFGATGPYSDFRAIGASTEMFSGWDSLMGYPEEPPIMLGVMYADAITGLHMAASALVALEHRDRTGRGQRVEGSMFEAAVGYIGEELMRASVRPGETIRRGNRHLDSAPYGVFRCSGDDRWIAIAARDEVEWGRLVAVASAHSGLDRAQFATNEARMANIDALERAITAWTAGEDAYALMAALQAAGVPAGVVQENADVMADPHFAARQWFIPMTHPDLGTHRYNGFNWRFSRSVCVAATPSPRLGEYSREVFREELGLSEAEIDGLYERGVSGETLQKQAAEAPSPA
jgi:crotonobetainyl-CoA:carnitine CoA-transferase CaiB-like acyl-CoA transferase